MELILKIAAGVLLVMMLFYLWPTYKRWQQEGPKPQAGDWQAVLIPLALVVGLVILLVLSLRT